MQSMCSVNKIQRMGKLASYILAELLKHCVSKSKSFSTMCQWPNKCLPSHENGDDDAEVSDDGEQDDGREDPQLLVVSLVEGGAAAAGSRLLPTRVPGLELHSLRITEYSINTLSK